MLVLLNCLAAFRPDYLPQGPQHVSYVKIFPNCPQWQIGKQSQLTNQSKTDEHTRACSPFSRVLQYSLQKGPRGL